MLRIPCGSDRCLSGKTLNSVGHNPTSCEFCHVRRPSGRPRGAGSRRPTTSVRVTVSEADAVHPERLSRSNESRTCAAYFDGGRDYRALSVRLPYSHNRGADADVRQGSALYLSDCRGLPHLDLRFSAAGRHRHDVALDALHRPGDRRAALRSDAEATCCPSWGRGRGRALSSRSSSALASRSAPGGGHCDYRFGRRVPPQGDPSPESDPHSQADHSYRQKKTTITHSHPVPSFLTMGTRSYS